MVTLISGNGSFKLWLPTRIYWKSSTTNLLCGFKPIYKKQCPKYIINKINKTMGSPACRKAYGFGGFVRGLRLRHFSIGKGIIENSCARLLKLKKLNKEDLLRVNNKLIHVVSDLDILVLAYKCIKSKSDNATSLDRINLDRLLNISKNLKAGKFSFKLARRVLISKKDKNKKRSLIISSSKGKIVQQAIYLILDAIYEPFFLNSSYGSIANRKNYTALKTIKYSLSGVK